MQKFGFEDLECWHAQVLLTRPGGVVVSVHAAPVTSSTIVVAVDVGKTSAMLLATDENRGRIRFAGRGGGPAGRRGGVRDARQPGGEGVPRGGRGGDQVTARRQRSGVEDRWHKADGTQSAAYGAGKRWRARYVDERGREHARVSSAKPPRRRGWTARPRPLSPVPMSHLAMRR